MTTATEFRARAILATLKRIGEPMERMALMAELQTCGWDWDRNDTFDAFHLLVEHELAFLTVSGGGTTITLK